MLVETIDHAKKILRYLTDVEQSRWVCLDTETQVKPKWAKFPEDALAFGRADIRIWSLCHEGTAYSFPTDFIGMQYPTIQEWINAIIRPLWRNRNMVKVFHNANYDLNVFYPMLSEVPDIWDTMIGCWMADNSIGKSLKERAPRYGVFLRETASVDFSNKVELASYAEDDVIATDLEYRMQRFGRIVITDPVYVMPNGKLDQRPLGFHDKDTKLVIPEECLTRFEKDFIEYQELRFLRCVIRAERLGFPAHISLLRRIRKQVTGDLDKSLQKCFSLAGETFNLNAPKQIAKIFDDLSIDNPYKTKKGAASFNEAALIKMGNVHPIIGQIRAAKRLTKLVSTYTGSSGEEGEQGMEHYIGEDWRIHFVINSIGAVTGRTSSQKPNGQNIPARKDTYGIKKCFVAGVYPKIGGKKIKPARRIGVLDYAQLELRVMALMAKDATMTRILCDPDGDIHSNTSHEFQVDRDPTAKQLNFLLQYGGMAFMLAEKLTLEGVPTNEQQAQGYINRFNEVYSRVKVFRDWLVSYFLENNMNYYATGRIRNLERPEVIDRYTKHKLETTLSNNIIQGSGQDFLKAAIIRCDWRLGNIDEEILLKWKLPRMHKLYLQDTARKLRGHQAFFEKNKIEWHLQVHDEGIWTGLNDATDEGISRCAEIMTWRHYIPLITPYTVPLVCEGGTGDNWFEAKKGKAFHVKAGFDSELEDYTDDFTPTLQPCHMA